MTRAIGGFLPLRLPAATTASVLLQWIGRGRQAWLLHNGRSALRALWDAVRPPRVWLPAYVCEEVAAAVPPEIEVRYYPLDPSLTPRVDFLSSEVTRGDHVLAVAYFGRPVGEKFASLARAHPEIGWIEDRAQALDTGDAAWGDWVLYSPRKLFGVPDGGILVSRTKPLPPVTTGALTDFAFLLPSLERFEDADERDNARWYAQYMRAEAAMTVEPRTMSKLSLAVLESCGASDDADVRRSNYRVLHSRLREWAFFGEPEIRHAPLGFPVRVESAARLSSALSERRIFAARHWHRLPSDPSTFKNEHRLAQQLLTLPCDYRYGETDMHLVADAVIDGIARS